MLLIHLPFKYTIFWSIEYSTELVTSDVLLCKLRRLWYSDFLLGVQYYISVYKRRLLILYPLHQWSRAFSAERAIKDSYFKKYFHESYIIFDSKYD